MRYTAVLTDPLVSMMHLGCRLSLASRQRQIPTNNAEVSTARSSRLVIVHNVLRRASAIGKQRKRRLARHLLTSRPESNRVSSFSSAGRDPLLRLGSDE